MPSAGQFLAALDEALGIDDVAGLGDQLAREHDAGGQRVHVGEAVGQAVRFADQRQRREARLLLVGELGAIGVDAPGAQIGAERQMRQRLGIIALALDGDMDRAGGEQPGTDRGACLFHVGRVAAAGPDQQNMQHGLAFAHIEIEGRTGVAGESGTCSGIAHQRLRGDGRGDGAVLGEGKNKALRLFRARGAGKDPHRTGLLLAMDKWPGAAAMDGE